MHGCQLLYSGIFTACTHVRSRKSRKIEITAPGVKAAGTVCFSKGGVAQMLTCRAVTGSPTKTLAMVENFSASSVVR